jgi:hypothetical protein
MQYFKVKDWRRFQHYTKRNPPWIKVHNELLEDPEFASLPDTAKFHLVGLWLFASRTENRLPEDADFLRSRINAKEAINLELLFSSGFLEWEQDASTPLAGCKQSAIPDQTRPEQSKPEQTRPDQTKEAETDLLKRLAGLYFEKTQKVLTQSFSDKLKLKKLSEQHDQDLIVRGFMTWLAKRVKGFEGLDHPLAVFAAEFTPQMGQPLRPDGINRPGLPRLV